MRKPGYFTYGEGSVMHNEEGCDHGLGWRVHPLIQRTQWPSRWHYYRWVIRSKLPSMIGLVPNYETKRMEYRPTLADRLWKIIAAPFGSEHAHADYPSVWAALAPEDSIYLDAVEEARRGER